MTAPAVAWGRSLWALALGAGLGGVWGFLRPLARKRAWAADILFVPVMLWAWIYHSFALCGGDPRLGYLLMGFLGAIGWELTAGKALGSLWSGLWGGIFRIWGTLSRVMKNIFKKGKKMFASLEKWGTINWSNRRFLRRVSGGDSHG